MADIIHVSKFGAYKDVKTLRAELKKNPKSAELHFLLGEELLRAHTPADDKKGLAHLEMAIKLDSDCAEAYGLLAYKTIDENPKKGARLAKKAAELFRAKGDDEQADAILDEAAVTKLRYVHGYFRKLIRSHTFRAGDVCRHAERVKAVILAADFLIMAYASKAAVDDKRSFDPVTKLLKPLHKVRMNRSGTATAVFTLAPEF